MTTEITVLTFNLWGIFNSKHCVARMTHFASKVRDYDIILLQEQFSESDFNVIVNNLPDEVRRTRHFKRYPTAFYGSGIAVISRFPIKSSVFFTFPLQGFPEQVLHGDYYANKGAAMLCVSVPCDDAAVGNCEVPHRDVLVYSTHLVAVYQVPDKLRDWRDEMYLAVRLSQAMSFANFIVATSQPSDHIIIGGDFNSTLNSLEVRTMLTLLRGHGYSLRSVLPAARRPDKFMTESECKENLARMTFSHENKFTSKDGKLITHGAYSPVQIDHIFVSFNTLRLCSYEDCPGADGKYHFKQFFDGKESPAGVVVFTRNDEVLLGPKRSCGSLCRCFLGMTPAMEDNGEERSCPLSDHYGVAARLQLLLPEHSSARDRTAPCKLTAEEEMSLLEVISFLEHSVSRMKRESWRYLILSGVFVLVMVICIIYVGARPYLQVHPTRTVLKNLVSLCHRSEHHESEGLDGASRKGGRATYRVEHFLNDTFSLHLDNTKPNPRGAYLGDTDYDTMASVLSGAGVLNILLPIIAVVSSIISFSCLIIALLNRKSYAKIISHQITELREGFLRQKVERVAGDR